MKAASSKNTTSPKALSAAKPAQARLSAVPAILVEQKVEPVEDARPARNAGRGIRPARAAWRTLVAVCKKCSGRPKHLQSELRKVFKKSDLHDVRVVRTGCLDVCPSGGTCCAVSDVLGVRSFVVMHDTQAEDVAGYIAAGRTAESAAVFTSD